MTEIIPFLYIATVADVHYFPDAKIVNLAHTFHYELHNWKLRGEEHMKDPCYLLHTPDSFREPDIDPRILSVNWVDANEAKYFDYQGKGVEVFRRIFDFISEWHKKGKVMVVCNKGESRAPSVVMAYLAKRTHRLSKVLPNMAVNDGKPVSEQVKPSFDSPPYGEARERFSRLYPDYLPKQGITQFLIDNWESIL